MAFGSEEEAFAAFYDVFGERSTMLIDTYDPLRGTEKVARMAEAVGAVRIDSGDFLEISRDMRAILDRHGKQKTKIMASGDLNEYRIEDLTRLGAPIDSYGVGTELITSKDAPALSGVYKLVEIERGGHIVYTAKFSEEKITYPGSKQVFRYTDSTGRFRHDLIACAGETPTTERGYQTTPLLNPVMQDGRRTGKPELLKDAQARCREHLGHLPPRYRHLVDAPQYPVRHSATLRALLRRTRETTRAAD
jgi:nicotinate phosphoribosyltransferase